MLRSPFGWTARKKDGRLARRHAPRPVADRAPCRCGSMDGGGDPAVPHRWNATVCPRGHGDGDEQAKRAGQGLYTRSVLNTGGETLCGQAAGRPRYAQTRRKIEDGTRARGLRRVCLGPTVLPGALASPGMCGRFAQRFSWREVYAFLHLGGGPAASHRPCYNLAPNQSAAVVSE